MTIAACYVTPEGVVLGADSTASSFLDNSGVHFYNHTQKLFEVGEKGTLAVVTWGMGAIGAVSHRTLVAMLADDLQRKKPSSVEDAAKRFAAKVSAVYAQALAAEVGRYAVLKAKQPFVAIAAPASDRRTSDEEAEFSRLRVACLLGFCIGGHTLPDRVPHAFSISYDLMVGTAPTISEIPMNSSQFWGAPKIFQRLIKGFDSDAKADVSSSPKWTGTPQELDAILGKHELQHMQLPIREAVDYIHICILATIKAIKFSTMPQICGGPIEIATVTSDRAFRWTRHKEWDSAISEGSNGHD